MNELDGINVEKILEFLALEDIDRHMRILILEYAKKNQKNVRSLISLIADITDVSLAMNRKSIISLEHAVEDMIHASDTSKDKDIPPDRYVVKYWRAIKEFYPNAECTFHSQKAKEFFNQFVEQLKLCKDEIIDSYWAQDVIESNDYFKKILEKNP
jgi:hypothetical protein